MNFNIFDKKVIFQIPIRIIGLPTADTYGITNQTKDNRWLLFLDYDDVEYNVVKTDIKFLQENYDVGTAMVRTSSIKCYKDETVGNFHVIFFTKFSFQDIKEMLECVRCDNKFKTMWKNLEGRCWVLRIGEKISRKDNSKIKSCTVFKEMIISKHFNISEMYKGLIELFERFDGMKFKRYFSYFDASTLKDVELIEYPTR